MIIQRPDRPYGRIRFGEWAEDNDYDLCSSNSDELLEVYLSELFPFLEAINNQPKQKRTTIDREDKLAAILKVFKVWGNLSGTYDPNPFTDKDLEELATDIINAMEDLESSP